MENFAISDKNVGNPQTSFFLNMNFLVVRARWWTATTYAQQSNCTALPVLGTGSATSWSSSTRRIWTDRIYGIRPDRFRASSSYRRQDTSMSPSPTFEDPSVYHFGTAMGYPGGQRSPLHCHRCNRTGHSSDTCRQMKNRTFPPKNGEKEGSFSGQNYVGKGGRSSGGSNGRNNGGGSKGHWKNGYKIIEEVTREISVDSVTVRLIRDKFRKVTTSISRWESRIKNQEFVIQLCDTQCFFLPLRLFVIRNRFFFAPYGLYRKISLPAFVRFNTIVRAVVQGFSPDKFSLLQSGRFYW